MNTCPYCGSRNHVDHYKEHRLVKCQECGTIFPFPRPDTKDYIKYVDSIEISAPSNSKSHELEVLKKYVNDLGLKTALDIGCGAGSMCKKLESINVRATGIDASQQSVDIARKNGVYAVRRAYPEDINGHYDIVIMNEVIYYFPDIKKALKKTREILTDKGILFIKTNMPEAYRKRTGKSVHDRAAGYFVQSVVTLDSLKYWLTGSGFDIVEIIPYRDEYFKMKFGDCAPNAIQRGFNIIYRNVCNPEHERYMVVARKAQE